MADTANFTATDPTPIIDTLFPGRRVHLIGGASGSGKTTWLMQTIEQWRKGEKIFGYASNPCPFVYLSYDRDWDDFKDTCKRLSIDPASYNFVAPERSDFKLDLLPYLKNTLLVKYPDIKLLIIEGIAMKTPEGKIIDQRIVGGWLRELQMLCKERDITIIGVLHSAKTKERDRYKEPRARIAGCGAWAGYSSTVVIIEEKEADGENELRELFILPRNARKHKFTLDFKDGLLVEIPVPLSEIPPARRFEEWLKQLPQPFFTINEAMEGTKIGRTYLSTTLVPKLTTEGYITRVDTGRYKFNARPVTN